jgi:hypothetical protein
MSTTQDFHTRWLAAIDSKRAGKPADSTLPGAAQPGFAVYANTGLVACVDALEANFRSVMRRLGQPKFRSLAVRYAREHPPTDARLFLYGDSFAEYLRNSDPEGDGSILSELGYLDQLWMQAHVAADAASFDHKRWSALDPATLASTTLQLAPATQWHRHALLPIWELWSATSTAGVGRSGIPGQGQAVLITRPYGDVLSCEMDVGGCAFLQACAQGQTLADAAEAALRRAPQTDLLNLLSLLFTQGAFVEREPHFKPTEFHP